MVWRIEYTNKTKSAKNGLVSFSLSLVHLVYCKSLQKRKGKSLEKSVNQFFKNEKINVQEWAEIKEGKITQCTYVVIILMSHNHIIRMCRNHSFGKLYQVSSVIAQIFFTFIVEFLLSTTSSNKLTRASTGITIIGWAIIWQGQIWITFWKKVFNLISNEL